jgi:clan AA aspartic protease (TIGR02281 family)
MANRSSQSNAIGKQTLAASPVVSRPGDGTPDENINQNQGLFDVISSAVDTNPPTGNIKAGARHHLISRRHPANKRGLAMAASRVRHSLLAVSLTAALFQMPLLLHAQAQETTSGSSKLIERASPSPSGAEILLERLTHCLARLSADADELAICRQNYWDARPPDAWSAPMVTPPAVSTVPEVVKTTKGDREESERKAGEPIERIAMVRTLGGVFVVPAEINGLPIDFVIDSGAAAVMVPAGMLERMRHDGTVTNEDILGPQTFTVADGTRRTWTAFMIRSLKVGGVVVQNIRGGAIESSQIITPLLGQSFLERLESWRIDNTSRELLLEPRVQLEAAKNPPAWPAVPGQPIDWGPLPHNAGIRLYTGMRPN